MPGNFFIFVEIYCKMSNMIYNYMYNVWQWGDIMDYQIETVQVAIMFINPLKHDFDYTKFIISVSQNIEKFKGTMPFTIPSDINVQLPIEIPRLTYQNNEEQLLISALRMDYTFKIKSNDVQMLRENLKGLDKIIENIAIDNPYRVGVVLTCSTNKENMLAEIKALIKFDDIDNSNEVQFAYLKNTNEDGLFLNEWVRYFYNKVEEKNNFVIDINNAANTPFQLEVKKHNGQILKRVLEVLDEFDRR